MKKILFTRHAKSSWSDGSNSDHDRPLNRRGIESARLLSKTMKSEFDKVQEVYISSAKRAQQTALELKIDRTKISTYEDLYTFDVASLETFIGFLNSNAQYIQLIGHNPAFTAFINNHSTIHIDNVPTCGMVILQWDNANDWSDVQLEKARLLLFDVPKRQSS
jgi:phosphohistidine phosphatase